LPASAKKQEHARNGEESGGDTGWWLRMKPQEATA
jgi:hypothetical protein